MKVDHVIYVATRMSQELFVLPFASLSLLTNGAEDLIELRGPGEFRVYFDPADIVEIHVSPATDAPTSGPL